MGLTGPLVKHPAEFSAVVLDVIVRLLWAYYDRFHTVVDPNAGRGMRLGQRVDQMGKNFFGIDIEDWADHDPRVVQGDSRDARLYPSHDYVIATSPPYFGNRISSDYVNGPKPSTKTAGRRAYGISLGRALHADNLARQAKHSDAFYAGLGATIRCWHTPLALLNVDSPMADQAAAQLTAGGFEVVDQIEVVTPRYRGPAGSDKRAACEVVLVGLK